MQSRVYLLIKVLGCKDFHRTLIEINLLIILNLYFTELEFFPTSIP